MTMQKVAPPVTVDAQQDYSIAEAAAIRRCSRAQVYKDLKAGRLVAFKRGRRTLVNGFELISRAGAPS
jgi:hypothetical protein